MNMIKKTRYKFIAITMSAISLVLILVLGIINALLYVVIIYNSSQDITRIYECDGFVYDSKMNNFFNDGTPGSSYIPKNISDADGKTAYMFVKINNHTGGTEYITTNMSDTYSSDDIFSIAETLIKSGSNGGFYNNMRYSVFSNSLYTTVVIVDLSTTFNLLKSTFRISAIIIISSLIFVFIFTYFLSAWAIKPVKTAFFNQRRFISDASHELKTPLTVISANADVLESEVGENRWLDNIKTQSVTMTELVHDLLDLAKLDETKDDMIMCEFDLSSTILNKTLEFECTAFENEKTLESNIKENVKFKGNEDSIKHLVTILIDNAIKHSDEHGTIRVTLNTDGNKKIFQVYNTGNGIRDDEKNKIFDRFYRSDKSRSRETGGYGLGLSIAKSIVETNKGSIKVDGEEGKWISFTVIL